MSLNEKTKEEEKIEPKLGDEIPDNWLIQAQKEINSEFRTINLKFRGEQTELRIYHANPGVEGEASDAYSKSFSRLLQDPDILTRGQMEKLIKDRGIWGEKQEEEIEEIREDMKDIELKVATIRKTQRSTNEKIAHKKIEEYRNLWTKKREVILSLIREKNKFLFNTVEGRAEEEASKVKLSLCVKYPDGRRVWNSLQELNKEIDRSATAHLLYDASIYWAGLTQEIIDELPAKLFFGGEEELENLQES